MKASLLITAALACSLASAASAQEVQGAQAPSKAPATKNSVTSKAIQMGSGTQGTRSAVSGALQRPGSSIPFVSGASNLCTTATPIAGTGLFAGDNIGGTMDVAGSIACAPNSVEVGDVWYNWTAGGTGSVTMSMCPAHGGSATFDTFLAVYDTAACPPTVLIACNDDSETTPSQSSCQVAQTWESTVMFGATIGNVYKIQIAGWDAASGFGNYGLNIQAPVVPPANDACATPTLVAGPGPHAFDNSTATRGTQGQGEASCLFFGANAINHDLWYKWTSTFTASARVTVCTQTTVDTKIAVYPGAPNCPAGGTALACNDDNCGLQSQLDFPATNGTSYNIQLGTFPEGFDAGNTTFGGAGTFTVSPTPLGPPNDGCSAPTSVFGAGPHNFDTSTANTGAEGQAEVLCTSNPGGMPINNDQWFKWTANGTGQAQLTTCGGLTTVDTKIAVYPGTPNCPPAGTALGCNDDNCGSLQSLVCWPSTNGVSYVIQMGTFPGATGGPGQFALSVAASGTSACKLDDGVSDNGLGWILGGEMAWIQKFGSGGNTNVSNIQVAWGSALFPGTTPPNGSPVSVLLYEDPNNDGVPNDVTLVQKVNTTVQNVDTDILNPVAVPASVMSGVFFAGASEVHSAGQFPATMDQTCPINDNSWFFGDNTAPLQPGNFTNPQTALFPPDSFLQNGFPANLLVRVCTSSPMVQNCFPGTGGVINCPCGQPANPVGGCANFGATATTGATLNASGTASLAADTLVLTTANHRTAPAAGILNVFFASTGTTLPNGVANGAGVRCYNQVLKRLYTGQTSPPASGSLSKPGMGDPSVSARSAALSSPISAGQTRHYFNLYRDAAATAPAACNNTLSNVNVTNAGSVLWSP